MTDAEFQKVVQVSRLDGVQAPLSYTMNRGTRAKWVEAMRAETRQFEPCQLAFDDCISPEGVLCEVVQIKPTIAWDGVSLLFDGEQFCVPPEALKRAKVRGTLPDFSDMERLPWSYDYPIWHRVAALIEVDGLYAV